MKNISSQVLGCLLVLGFTMANAQAAAPSSLNPKLDRLWQAHLDKQPMHKIQEGCRPRMLPADPQAPHQGSVFLIHGYTACPQQYFELATHLNAAGFDVYLPLTPGHGRIPLADGSDDISDFPDIDSWSQYLDFADEVNALAEAARGQRIIGGLSVGATVALIAAQRKPFLYKKQLLLSPFFAVVDPLYRGLMTPIGTLLPNLRNKEVGWGDPCFEERKLGRAGMCQFRTRHIAGAQELGQYALKNIRPLTWTKTQIVGVEADGAAFNEQTLDAIRKHRLGSEKVSACFYPAGVNHSLLSRFDSPHEEKFWVEGALKQIARFVLDGEFFSVEGMSSERPEALCALVQ